MTPEYPLTQDQNRIFTIIESTIYNYLIHGKPGVGKSVLNRALDILGKKSYTKGAPTGIAAININGKTLHSIFGIPTSSGIIPPNFNNFTTNKNVIANIRYTVKYLIIDEISMVRSDILDYIDRCLRFIKGVDLPFGGIQVIAVGDFFQLPPVVNREDKAALLAAGWKSEFAFDAHCFDSFKPLILSEVLRQKGDKKFIEILHAARDGSISQSQMNFLNKRVGNPDDIRIRVVAINKQAEAINDAHLRTLPGEEKEYHANSSGSWPEFPHDTIVTLKIGAQVIIKKNAADRPPGSRGNLISEVVNGSLGVVVELPEKEEDDYQKVMVQLRNGHVVPIYTNRWERKEKKFENGQWTEITLASFEQVPLQLAWAISMHKSQGQTFDAVHVDPSAVFLPGQLYVALSRSRTLEGLSLEHPVEKKHFLVKQRVIDYVDSIEI